MTQDPVPRDAQTRWPRLNRVAFLSIGMLVTGALNTLTIKFQDEVVVAHTWRGEPVTFYHPAVQSTFMFLGEFLCLVPYVLRQWRRRRRAQQRAPRAPADAALREPLLLRASDVGRLDGGGAEAGNGSKLREASQAVFVLALPTLCDAASAVLMNIGLYYTAASVFQMLRGTVVFFAAVFTIVILKRRLYLHHWQGLMLIAVGAFVVGLSSVLNPACDPPTHHHTDRHFPDPRSAAPSEDSSSAVSTVAWALAALRAAGSGGGDACHEAPRQALLGNTLVMAAQVFSALQFVVEEKYVKQYRVPSLLAVGLEGFWGLILSCGYLPLFQNTRLQASDGWPIDDAKKGLVEVASNGPLLAAAVGSILSMALYNYFGVSVMKQLSAASRLSIDACRTALVWALSVVAGWESFVGMQLFGFLILICGTTLYNELLASAVRDNEWQGPPQYPAGFRGRGGPSHWGQAPPPRPSTSSAYDVAPSLRIGGVFPEPHSLGSMGGRADSDVDLWGAPSMSTSSSLERPQTPSHGPTFAALRAQASMRRQDSVDTRATSGSLYNAFYSGMDISATTPAGSASSVLRSEAISGVGTPRVSKPRGGDSAFSDTRSRGIEADDVRPPSRTASSAGLPISPRQRASGRGPSTSDGPRRTSSETLPRISAAAGVAATTSEVPGSTSQRKSMLSAQLQGAVQRGRGHATAGRTTRHMPQSVSTPALPMQVAMSSAESNELAYDERSVGTSELAMFGMDSTRSASRDVPAPGERGGAV